MQKRIQKLEDTLRKALKHTVHATPPADQEEGTDDEEMHDCPESLASFCIEQVMVPGGPTFASLLAMVQMFLLSAAEYILAFGYFDSIHLQNFKSEYPLFSDAIAPSEFYTWRVPFAQSMSGFGQESELRRTFSSAGCTAGGGAAADAECQELPRINVLASLVAMCLLAAGPLLADDHQTLCMMTPTDCLLFDTRILDVPHGSRTRVRFLSVLIWRVCSAAVMQALWAIRVLAVPAMGVLGTATALIESDSAFDVVLNAIAFGFILDIDDMLYLTVLPAHKRTHYSQRRTIPPCSPLVVPGSATIAWRWSWPLVAVDVAFPVYCFFVDTGLIVNAAPEMYYVQYRLALIVCLRAAVFAAAYLHLNTRALWRGHAMSGDYRHDIPRVPSSHRAGIALSRALGVLRLLLSAAILVGSAFWVHLVAFAEMDQYAGFVDFTQYEFMSESSVLFNCLNSVLKQPGCAEGAGPLSGHLLTNLSTSSYASYGSYLYSYEQSVEDAWWYVD